MPLDVSNIITSKATIYYAATTATQPAENLAYDAAWPAGWTKLGFTSAPLTLAYEYETMEGDMQDALAALTRDKNSEKATFETMIGEFDLDLMPLTWGGKTVTTAAGVSQMGKQRYTVGNVAKLQILKWGFEAVWTTAAGIVLPIRAYMWRATATAGGPLEFGKKSYIGTSLKLGALCDMSKPADERLFAVDKFTAVATS